MPDRPVNDEIFELISDLFDVDLQEVSLDSSPDTLPAWDSLGHMRLMAAIEETFRLTLSPEEQVDMLTVDLVVEIVSEKLSGISTS